MPAAVPAAALVCALAWAGCALPAPAGAAPGWLPAEKLAPEGVAALSQAVSPSGEAVTLDVRQVAPSEYRVEARARPPGGSFSSPVLLSPAGSSSEEPQVAVGAQGSAIAVWRHGGLVEYSLRPSGGSFEKPRVLSGESESATFGTHVAMTPTGEAVASWVGHSPGTAPPFTETLHAAALAAGAHTFGPPQTLESVGPFTPPERTGQLRVPPPAVDGKGDVYLLADSFEEVPGFAGHTTSELHVFERPPGGSFGAGTLITAADRNSIEEFLLDAPSVAAGPGGDAVVVWHKSNLKTASSRVEASVQPAGGAFEALGAVEAVSGERKGTAEPEAAVDAAGNVAVAFIGEDLSSRRAAVLEADRPAGGSFGRIETVSDPTLETGSSSPQLPQPGAAPNGELVVLWARYEEPSRIEASTRSPGGAFTAPQAISAAAKSGTLGPPLLDFDGAGDAVATWRSAGAQEVAVHDVSGPVLTGLSIPAGAVVGVPAAFSVSALDTFSPPVLTEWAFGDGAVATGPGATHTYARAGTFAVTVRSTDALGNASTASGTIAVTAAPPPRPTAPKLGSLSQAHRSWRTGRALAALASRRRPPVGTSFSFKLDQAARVTLTFRQAATGRRVKGRCAAPSRRNRRGRRCVRTLTRGTLTVAAHAGLDRLTFQGRLPAGKTLPPGAYTVTFVAAGATGLRSAAVRLTFQIVR